MRCIFSLPAANTLYSCTIVPVLVNFLIGLLRQDSFGQTRPILLEEDTIIVKKQKYKMNLITIYITVLVSL